MDNVEQLSRPHYPWGRSFVTLAGLTAMVFLYCLQFMPSYNDFTSQSTSLASGIRGSERRLPGYDINPDQLMGAEVGFVVALVLVLFFFACLCGCCCGRGGCSLWDLVACVCLYEMCCDNDARIGDFQLI